MRPRVYLGGSMGAIPVIVERNKMLRAMGYDVASTWAEVSPDRSPRVAAIAVLSSSLVVICTEVLSSSGGYFVEIGLAVASGKTLVIVGELNNIWAELAAQRFATWEECVPWLRMYLEVQRCLG
jgi:hypothetical protein